MVIFLTERLGLRRGSLTCTAFWMACQPTMNDLSSPPLFCLLCEQTDKNKCGPTDDDNVDETGLTSALKSQSKAISLRGRMQAGCLTPAERGSSLQRRCVFQLEETTFLPSLYFQGRGWNMDYLMQLHLIQWYFAIYGGGCTQKFLLSGWNILCNVCETCERTSFFSDVQSCLLGCTAVVSFYTAVQPRRQLWTSYSPPWELEISHPFSLFARWAFIKHKIPLQQLIPDVKTEC
jgi:hypothetical protein